MNKSPDKPLPAQGNKKAIDIVNAGLAKRYSAEKRFQAMGIAAIALSLLFLVILFGSIFANGYTAFFQTYVQVDVHFSEDYVDPQDIPGSNFPGLVKKSLRNMFPDVSGRGDRRQLYAMVSSDAGFRLPLSDSRRGRAVGGAQRVQPGRGGAGWQGLPALPGG